MESIILLLGVLFILVLFNVGESNLKNGEIQKSFVLIFIIIELCCLFVSPYEIAGMSFTVSGFFLPALISLFFLGEIKNKKYVSKIIISFLSVVFLMQLFFFLRPYILIENEQIIWIVMALILATVSLVICHYPKQAFVPFFWGIIFAQMALNHANFMDVNLTGLKIVGDEIMLFGLIVGSLFLFFCYNIFYSIKRKHQAKAFQN